MNINLSILAAVAGVMSMGLPLTAGSTPRAWPSETLSGKITVVDPVQKVVVVQTPDGVPYDIDITANTDLARDINKQVSVEFVPERRGDVARSIRIGG
jgi:hypothetical protein